MDQKTVFTSVGDDLLENISGGYLQVSKWSAFLSSQIMPVLNGLMSAASDNDRSILNTSFSILQGTLLPGAPVAQPVRDLWSNYNTVYRPRLQSDVIKRTMDQALYNAKQYIDQNA